MKQLGMSLQAVLTAPAGAGSHWLNLYKKVKCSETRIPIWLCKSCGHFWQWNINTNHFYRNAV